MIIHFIGHACFEIGLPDHNLIIDPYLTDNPVTEVRPDQVEVDYILVTHGH